MQKIKIISEPTQERPFLVIFKPQGIPSAPLAEHETCSALNQAICLFPEIKNVRGRKIIEYGLMHRIDTQTAGLLLIATSQLSYDALLDQQNAGKFIKTYRAECISTARKSDGNTNPVEKQGYPPADTRNRVELEKGNPIKIKSFFRNYGEGLKEVRPVTENSGKAALKKIGKQKEYETEVRLVSKNNLKFCFECKISSGFRHQVRCHLAWLDFPIIGDKIYNPFEKNKDTKMKFMATGLQFINPLTKQEESFFLKNYPEGDLNP